MQFMSDEAMETLSQWLHRAMNQMEYQVDDAEPAKDGKPG